ncbi:MAG: DUF835 domain-containing protein, partial [Candidatus Thermoplasmatota archaeon]|nr:DUF835 domain-containing protein [Candidatus Thermoplasmatota archaeon]
MVELPQGVVIEVRRGGHDALAKLSADMMRLGISGYLRIERRPKNLLPRVSQILILDGQPKLAIHESDLVLGGLEALLEIERDAATLDALISLIELSNDDAVRVVNLYPDFALVELDEKSEKTDKQWWNYVRLESRSWRREARLPEPEVIVEAPEYIRQLTKAKLQKFDLGQKYLNYGDALLNDGDSPAKLLDLAGILASHGRPILVFSRDETNSLVANHNIPESSCLIISTVESKQSIPPNSTSISEKINDFLWANKQAVIVITNLEYLISIIDFDIVSKMLRDIIDNIRSSDHLLLVHCDLDVMNDQQRHIFMREFETINSIYLESLVMDPESLFEHPICMELTDEELSWIQQQITFSKTGNIEQLTASTTTSGGAINLADEDLVEARDNLTQVIDNWQDLSQSKELITPPNIEQKKDDNMISNMVNKAFSADIDTIRQDDVKSTRVSKPKTENPRPVVMKNSVTKKSKGPRPAIRVKRAKRPKPHQSKSFSRPAKTVAAISNNVELPNIVDITEVNRQTQAFTASLDERA